MSKEELLALVAPLSPAERRELRELLDDEEVFVESDPMLKALREIEQLPPMDAPADFSVNHKSFRRSTVS